MKQCSQCGQEWADNFQFCPYDATALSSSPADPLVGQVLANKYEILERLGQGPHGTVYRARHRIADQPCAVKLLDPNMTRLDTQLQRLRTSVQIGLKLRSPYTVRVHDFDYADGVGYFLVEELAEGESLQAFLREQKLLPAQVCAALLRQISESLAEAHGQGFRHGHLSTTNVLVTGSFLEITAKVSDYGFGDVNGVPTTTVGQEFAVDVVSLGGLLYQMLTGETPFVSPDGGTLNLRNPEEHTTALQRVDAPRPLRELALRLLDPIEDGRLWSAADVLSALGDALPGDSAKAGVSMATEREKSSVSTAVMTSGLSEATPATEESQAMWEAQPGISIPRVALVLLVVAGLGAGLFWLLRSKPAAKPQPTAPVEAEAAPAHIQDSHPRFDTEIVQRDNEGNPAHHAHVLVRIEGLPLYIIRDEGSYPSTSARAQAVVQALQQAAENLRSQADARFALTKHDEADVIVQKGAVGTTDLAIISVTHADLHGYQVRSQNKKITHDELSDWWLARTRDYLAAFVLGNAPYQTKSNKDGAALAQLYWQVRARSKDRQEPPIVLLRQALNELDPKLKEDLQRGIFQFPVKSSP